MAITPSEILDLAENLANEAQTCEAYTRSAISRAYYAAFLSADAEISPYLEEKAIKLEGEGVHTQLIGRITAYASTAKLIRPGFQEAAYISKSLVKMKFKRVEADYRLDRDLEPQEAHKAIRQARRVLENLENFREKAQRVNAAEA